MLDFETIAPPMPTNKFLEYLCAFLAEKQFKLLKIKQVVSKIGVFAENHTKESNLLGGLKFSPSASGYTCPKLEKLFWELSIDTDYLRKTMDKNFLFVSMEDKDKEMLISNLNPEYRDYIINLSNFIAQKE